MPGVSSETVGGLHGGLHVTATFLDFGYRILDSPLAHRPGPASFKMARKAIQKDQIVKLIVGAGQASPSPPVGPALGSKGVKSMDFCKVCAEALHAFMEPV